MLRISYKVDESPKMTEMLEAAGVSVINISSGCHETLHYSNDIMRLEEGFKLPLWSAVKKAVTIPTIAGGGNRNPDKCETIIADGNADFIGLGRALIADPEWPRKAMEGRTKDIRRCISCGLCLYTFGGVLRIPQACSVNAAYSKEGNWSEINPAGGRKKVMIVGGGVAGMETARVASLRGHEVTIFEREKELGGQLLLAATPPGKEKMLWFKDYLTTQLEKQGVEVKLGVEVTPEMIDKQKPEALIVAAGAQPLVPDIPGIKDERVVSAWDVLGGKATIRNKQVVIIGGGQVGCEIAEFVAEQGNEVTVVEMLPTIASDAEPTNRRGLLDSLKDHKIKLLTNLTVTEITKETVIATTDKGKKQSIQAEAVVFAFGSEPVRELVDLLEDKGIEFHAIGDCEEPRKVLEAVYDGSLVGRQI
jgi:pyruvate/2-oxoglutarate dehydrogenase complex dihydrolipoamide dehydrogenase (E3) component